MQHSVLRIYGLSQVTVELLTLLPESLRQDWTALTYQHLLYVCRIGLCAGDYARVMVGMELT